MLDLCLVQYPVQWYLWVRVLQGHTVMNAPERPGVLRSYAIKQGFV
jgi:hypothetical protein